MISVSTTWRERHDCFQRSSFSRQTGARSGVSRRPQEKCSAWPGLRHVNIIKTADRNYCIIAEWSDMDALAKARPAMIATLDTFRHVLEDFGGGLGVTDPVAGPVVLELK